MARKNQPTRQESDRRELVHNHRFDHGLGEQVAHIGIKVSAVGRGGAIWAREMALEEHRKRHFGLRSVTTDIPGDSLEDGNFHADRRLVRATIA